MKKVLIVLIASVFLTGCGKDKILKCTYKDKKDVVEIKTEQLFIFNSEGTKIKKIKATVEYVYDKNYLNLISSSGQTLENLIDTESVCEEYMVNDNVSCKTTINDNKLIINIEDDFKDNFVKNDDMNYSAVKKTYSSMNYICE